MKSDEIMVLPSNPRVTYKIASVEDIIAMTGEKPKASLRALVFYLDGIPSGLGGYKLENGAYILFSDIKESVNVSKLTIFRCAKIIMEFAKKRGMSMYAVGGNPDLLERLGLVHIGDGDYKWQP